MQFPSQGKPPVGIVFDSDLGDGVDGALALALLYGLEGKNEARLISNSTTKASLKSAAFGDALARFFAGPPPAAGSFGGFGRPVSTPPIGMADNGKLAADTPILNAVVDKKTDDGKPVYPNGIVKRNDTADPIALIRNAMTAQADQNCIVLLAGPATNIVKVMDLAGCLDLIQRKVKLLIVAAGRYPEGSADPRVKADVPAARRLFVEWPTPIVAVGAEVGEGLPFPGASIEKDFAWAPAHPIVDAYRADRPMPYDAAAPSMAAVLYAARPDCFKLSAAGRIAVLDDGGTHFTPAADGHSRYLTIDPDQKDKVIQSYVELTSAKPAPRQGGRGRPNNQKQDTTPPPRAPEPKNP